MIYKAIVFWLDLKIVVGGYWDCCPEYLWNSRVLVSGNNILQRVLESAQYKVKLEDNYIVFILWLISNSDY